LQRLRALQFTQANVGYAIIQSLAESLGVPVVRKAAFVVQNKTGFPLSRGLSGRPLNKILYQFAYASYI
jgi:hypothetical protein